MAQVIVRKYSEAFFTACESGNADKCMKELGMLAQLDDHVIDMLQNPIIDTGVKLSLVKGVLDGYEPEVVNLILLLVQNRHIESLKEINEYVNDLYMYRHNIRMITIVSARKLPDDTIDRIKAHLIKEGDAKVKNEVDPDIIGGIQIKSDDKMLDLSIKSKLTYVKRSLHKQPINVE